MGALPFVSVVVACRNGEKTIGACLRSLLDQDYPKDRFEIIVVDNDSTDRTADEIRRYPVTYVFENQGHSAAYARNRGVQEARGEIVAFTDSDCVASAGWLQHGVSGFSEESIGCVAGEIKAFPPQTQAQRYAEARGALSQVWTLTEAFKPFVQGANAFYRRSVLDQLHAFDTSLVICEDADLSWRMQDALHLTIAFRPNAVVQHQHRETVRALLKQREGYGYSSVLLYRKYRDQMGPWTLKQTYWDGLALTRRVGRFLGACGTSLWAWCRGRREWDPVVMASLDVCSYLWWKLGQLKGSIKYRVWYV